jgi:hypothetical protein
LGLRTTQQQLWDALAISREFNPVYRQLLKLAVEERQLIEQQMERLTRRRDLLRYKLKTFLGLRGYVANSTTVYLHAIVDGCLENASPPAWATQSISPPYGAETGCSHK